MVKIRGYRIVISLMLIVLLASCFLTLLFSVLNVFQENKEDSSNSVYLDRLTYTITNSTDDLISNYFKYDYFRIADDYGYQTFCDFINNKQNIAYTNGNLIANDYFANKIVYLDTNISGMTYRAHQFSGLFDGCGFTLSEFDIACDSDNFTGGILFNTLNTNGTIKNLKMYANRVTIEGGSAAGGDKVVFGGIIGENNGTIEECIVSTVRFNSDRYADVLFVAPIAGKNNGTITNCFVNGKYYLRGNDNNGIFAGSDGMHAYYFKVEGKDPTNSVYQATVVEEEVTERIYAPNENGEEKIRAGTDSLGDSNYDSTLTAQTSMNDSVLDNSPGEGGTPWFNYGAFSYKGENNYFVYLRNFIDWTTFCFDRDGDGTYDQEVLAPTDCRAQVVQYIVNNLSTHNISIFDSTIYPNITGYNFDGWEQVDDLHYKATKSIQTYDISFNICDNATVKVGDEEVTSQQSYVVEYNTRIFVDLTQLGKSGAYSIIKFSFKDSSGNEVEVKYESNTTYYFEGYMIGVALKTDTLITVTGATTFDLNAILKTYTPDYQ